MCSKHISFLIIPMPAEVDDIIPPPPAKTEETASERLSYFLKTHN